MVALVHGMLEALAWFVAPARCAACEGPVRYRTAFCKTCVGTLVRAPLTNESRVAAFVYGGAIAEAIRRFKFDDRPDLAHALVAGLGPHLRALAGAAPDLVVPVPLHPSRLVERGYNQAALLARPLASRLGVPCAPRALRRHVATARQTELTREARAANVVRAFEPTEPARLVGKAVLLVDDVETTGATLDACARALKAAGARAVRTVVIARAGSDGGAA